MPPLPAMGLSVPSVLSPSLSPSLPLSLTAPSLYASLFRWRARSFSPASLSPALSLVSLSRTRSKSISHTYLSRSIYCYNFTRRTRHLCTQSVIATPISTCMSTCMSTSMSTSISLPPPAHPYPLIHIPIYIYVQVCAQICRSLGAGKEGDGACGHENRCVLSRLRLGPAAFRSCIHDRLMIAMTLVT
jgi:hypothetical protein